MDHEERLKHIIRKKDWLMKILRIVRELDLPDWYIAAGVIRNTVWDVLHEKNGTPLNDVDVIYFDKLDMNGEKERKSMKILNETDSSIKWEVVNQARGHLFRYPSQKKISEINSSCEAISYWSETANCVGVKLEKNDSLIICAPHGLSDLMELRVRPIPEPYRDLALYKRRIESKMWNEIWPKLRIEKV